MGKGGVNLISGSMWYSIETALEGAGAPMQRGPEKIKP